VKKYKKLPKIWNFKHENVSQKRLHAFLIELVLHEEALFLLKSPSNGKKKDLSATS